MALNQTFHWADQSLRLIALLCGVMAAGFVGNLLTGGFLTQWGIHPRQLSSLWTIFTAPFLHASFGHLMNNLAGFSVLAFLVLLRGKACFIQSSVIIIVIGGLLVWMFARSANHIGASGWIFGLWSLLLAMAWFERSFTSIALAIAVLFFYGGMIWGILPLRSFVSFESHLFGLIAGILAAFLWRKGLRLFS
jgi:membrane associated rhomboid family serine protease